MAAAPPDDATVQAAGQAYNELNARGQTVQPADFTSYLEAIVARSREVEPITFNYAMLVGGAFFPIGGSSSPDGNPGEAWSDFLRAHIKAALASSATTPVDRQIYRTFDVGLAFGSVRRNELTRDLVESINLKIEALAADYPDVGAVQFFCTLQMARLVKFDPALADAWAAKLARSSSPAAAKAGQGRLAVNAGATKAVEARFTALDGRDVDLAQLRGKVVLVDFWATWCGPCVAELPNVKRVYEAYRAKGFEVIGVTLEKASVSQSDSPEAREKKLAAARKKLADYVAKQGLPWPQKLEGDFGNDLVTRYNILAIPATLLLDQNGVIANSSDIRGEKLEAEVKRLLKI